MMAKWRPEGWGNPYPIEAENNPDSAYAIGRRGYEAGADAMLDTLREKAQIILLGCNQATDDAWVKVVLQNLKGRWVFIPDDENIA